MMHALRPALLAAALAAAGFTLPALAQGTKAPPAADAKASSVAAADRKFMEEAAVGGLLEVQLGELSQQKAATDPVRQFGARMKTDHGKGNDELKSLAASKGVTLPAELDAKHQKDVDKLAKTTKFDHEYMEYMVKDHKQDIADFTKASKSAKDPDVRAWATKTLPTLHEHLKLAQATAKSAKK